MIASALSAPLSLLLRSRAARGVARTRPLCLNAVSAEVGASAHPPVTCFYADWAEVPLPEGHRFPMHKYAETRLLLEQEASLSGRLNLRPSPLVSLEDLHRAHCPVYADAVLNGTLTAAEQRAVGFPWSREHVTRSLASTGGTVAAMHLVLSGAPEAPVSPQQPRSRHRCALQIAGGTHHAHRERGGGFCVFNDQAVAAHAALHNYALQRILIVDLDVHLGDGTASIFADEPRVTTFSMHGEKNYPWRAAVPSDYDVDLPDGTGDEAYLAKLNEMLPLLFERHQPQLVFYQAGVDPLKGDAFGRLALSRAGLQARNNAVFSACLRAGAPLVAVMGGGYTRPSHRSVEAHADVFRAAALRFSVP